MVAYLGTAYRILHLDGYYDGETSVKAIEAGFDAAYEIIEKTRESRISLLIFNDFYAVNISISRTKRPITALCVSSCPKISFIFSPITFLRKEDFIRCMLLLKYRFSIKHFFL
jgi:hypothetical protein